jgi:membrane fusion protein, multidrug efflux system
VKRLCLSVLLLSACDRSAAEAPAAAAPAAPPSVEVVPVASETLHLTATLPGELTPYEMVAVYPRVTGFVEEVRVDRGSKVKKGAVLARLSAPELAAQRTEAESKTIGDKSTVDRLRAASSTPGAVAGHDIELAESTLKAQEARVSSLKTLESYLVVRAPFDGVITERNVHPGALVGPPTGPNAVPMLRVEQVGHLRLTVAVPENDVGAISDGAAGEFSVQAWPGKRFSGTVRRVSHAIDQKTRTMPVELDVDNAEGTLASGMYAEVRWPIVRNTPSLLVPASAVVQTTERTYVDRVRSDGTLEQVLVRRGATVGDRLEVVGQLAAGDLVLKRGSEELANGARVNAKKSAPDGGASK